MIIRTMVIRTMIVILTIANVVVVTAANTFVSQQQQQQHQQQYNIPFSTKPIRLPSSICLLNVPTNHIISNLQSRISPLLLLDDDDHILDSNRDDVSRTSRIRVHNDDSTTTNLIGSSSTRSHILPDNDNNIMKFYNKRRHQRQQQYDISIDTTTTTSSNTKTMMDTMGTKPLDLVWRNVPASIDIPNNNIQQSHIHQEFTTKTGTTIVGISGPNYCILGADTRSTNQHIVANKYCCKIHALSYNCAIAGAGTSADLYHLSRECYYTIQLWFHQHPLTYDNKYTSPPSVVSVSSSLQSIGNDPIHMNIATPSSSLSGYDQQDRFVSTVIPIVSVQQICRLLQQRLYEQWGTCSAHCIVGGIDSISGHGILRAIHPYGNIDTVSYTALGSGSYAAMSVLENAILHHQRRHHRQNHQLDQHDDRIDMNDDISNIHQQHNLTMDEAIALVVQAVQAGIDHDLGSGSQVDICILSCHDDGIIRTNYTRCYVPEERYTNDDEDASTANSINVHDPLAEINKNINSNMNKYNYDGINGFGNVPYHIRSKRMLLKYPTTMYNDNLVTQSNENEDQQQQDDYHSWKDIFE